MAETSLQRRQNDTTSISSFFSLRVTSPVTVATRVNRESHWSVAARSKDYRRVTQYTRLLGIVQLILRLFMVT